MGNRTGLAQQRINQVSQLATEEGCVCIYSINGGRQVDGLFMNSLAVTQDCGVAGSRRSNCSI